MGGWVSTNEAELVKFHPRPNRNGESARNNLGKEPPSVTSSNPLKLAAVICDQPGENIQPARCAFGVSLGLYVLGQEQLFKQRHHVHAPLLENRPSCQVDLGDPKVRKLFFDSGVGPGEKTRTHSVSNRA